MIEINVLDEISPWLRRKAEALTDFRQPLARSQRRMLESTQRNFQAGGRPKWAPLAKSTVLNRPNGGTRPLVDTGDFRGSIDATTLTKTETAIGTNKKFGPIHQYGGTINVPALTPRRGTALSWVSPAGNRVFAKRTKAHTVTIPARPFFVFQLQDRAQIIGYFKSHIEGA